MTEQQRRRVRIPARLFGGKVRTTTFSLCVLWVGLWMLYLFLNQPEEPIDAPPTAVIISDMPYVPYVPPVETPPSTQTTVPGTTTDTPTPSTTVPPTGSVAPTSAVPTAPSTVPTTTTRQFPFDLPQIPGFPGGSDTSDTTGTGEPGQ